MSKIDASKIDASKIDASKLGEGENWHLYNELIKIKHPHVQTRYPFSGISGANIEHTLNTLTLAYDKENAGKILYQSHSKPRDSKPHETPKKGKRTSRKNVVGGYKKTGTITVYI